VGGKQRIGEWNGSLEFNEMDTVILPPPYWNGIDPGHVQFKAKLITPNHRIREGNEANNVFTSNMELAPRWEPIRVMMRTNGQPQENRVEITDQNGTIVWEQKDLNANEIYNWNVNLSAGCYKFTIYDEGFDGLHWWVYAQSGQPTRTGGFIRVMKQTGAGIYVNKNDFGREYSENFIIGEMTVAEAPVTTAEDIEVFPNPSKDGEINVLIPGWNVGLAKITVTDRLGRIILERENTPTDTEHWEVLKVKTLIDSFFFVKVEAGDKVKTEKVLIFEN
jgi:hypothetical protein